MTPDDAYASFSSSGAPSIDYSSSDAIPVPSTPGDAYSRLFGGTGARIQSFTQELVDSGQGLPKWVADLNQKTSQGWNQLALMQARSDAQGSSNFLDRWGRTLTEHPGWNALPFFGQLVAGPIVTTTDSRYGGMKGLAGIHLSPRAQAFATEVASRHFFD